MQAAMAAAVAAVTAMLKREIEENMKEKDGAPNDVPSL